MSDARRLDDNGNGFGRATGERGDRLATGTQARPVTSFALDHLPLGTCQMDDAVTCSTRQAYYSTRCTFAPPVAIVTPSKMHPCLGHSFWPPPDLSSNPPSA